VNDYHYKKSNGKDKKIMIIADIYSQVSKDFANLLKEAPK
jgi:hypothetical protein